jgi:NDP-sugar pyrophosphorylase family protein
MTTATMTETVLRIAKISGADNFIMTMPDTLFSGDQPYEFLARKNSGMRLALWRIRDEQKGKLGQVKFERSESDEEGVIVDSRDKDPNCDFAHSWGAMSFNRSVLDFADPVMPHTGYLIPELISAKIPIFGREMAGSYYDCGTPEEYVRMLTNEINSTL